MQENPKILLVDDDEDIREILGVILGKNGYQITMVESGAMAIEAVKNEPFNLAIIDLNLPDLTGLEVSKKINEINEDIITIIITGFASLETAVEAMNAGAYSYIVKPFNIDAVVTTAKQAIEKQRLSVENKHLAQELKERNEELAGLYQELKDR